MAAAIRAEAAAWDVVGFAAFLAGLPVTRLRSALQRCDLKLKKIPGTKKELLAFLLSASWASLHTHDHRGSTARMDAQQPTVTNMELSHMHPVHFAPSLLIVPPLRS